MRNLSDIFQLNILIFSTRDPKWYSPTTYLNVFTEIQAQVNNNNAKSLWTPTWYWPATLSASNKWDIFIVHLFQTNSCCSSSSSSSSSSLPLSKTLNMENGNGEMIKWRFRGNEKINTASGITVRGVLTTVMSALDPSDKRPILPLGHGDPSAFACFRTTEVAEDAIVEAVRSAKFNCYSPTVGVLPARRYKKYNSGFFIFIQIACLVFHLRVISNICCDICVHCFIDWWVITEM